VGGYTVKYVISNHTGLFRYKMLHLVRSPSQCPPHRMSVVLTMGWGEMMIYDHGLIHAQLTQSHKSQQCPWIHQKSQDLNHFVNIYTSWVASKHSHWPELFGMWQCVGVCGVIRNTIVVFHHRHLPWTHALLPRDLCCHEGEWRR
jgi:hypothetical protein